MSYFLPLLFMVISLKSGCVAMSAFTRALYETNMVMVCRYVWRNNSQPKLMILIPRIKSDHEVMNQFLYIIASVVCIYMIESAMDDT